MARAALENEPLPRYANRWDRETTMTSKGMLRLGAVIAVLGLSACENVFDFRPGPASAGQETRPAEVRPPADDRGIISYPGYQVAVARDGDTPASVATRVGLTPVKLATFNGIPEGTPLRAGELLVLNRRVAEPSSDTGAIVDGPLRPGAVNITALAAAAIDRANPVTVAAIPASAPAVSGRQPIQHRVQRGETVYDVSRLYGVPVQALAEWNGLGPDLGLNEGRNILIPVIAVAQGAGTSAQTEAPGVGSEAPEPPSAGTPLPEEPEEARIAAAPTPPITPITTTAPPPRSLEEAEIPPLPESVTAAVEAPVPATPAPIVRPEPVTPPTPIVTAEPDPPAPAPEPAGPSLRTPVAGPVVRPFSPGGGVDISGTPGAPVRSAAEGTVGSVTETEDGSIVVIKHRGGLLTVYQNVDGLQVSKGQSVGAGEVIASVPEGKPVVEFQVRRGFEALDPAGFLE